MGCRKSVARLTLSERQAFVNAVLQLKADGGYDPYVTQHRFAASHGHSGPAFFPWHREYLRRFEDDLQAIDSSVNLPYWDWTVENLNPAGTDSLIWRDDFVGGPGDPANGFSISGPFSGWGLTRNNFNRFQAPGGGGLIASLMANPDYTTFRQIEGPHGGAHIWVGGNVGNSDIAPQDPVFWLIHANIDRLWAEWTTQHSGQAGWVQYAPTSGGPQGHNLNDTMWPWNGTTFPTGIPPWTVVPESRRPADMLDHRVFDTFYDTIDPECRRRWPKRFQRKELIKEKEAFKENLKDRLSKELLKDKEFSKENLKDRLPKEFKEIREGDPKRIVEIDPKGPREVLDPVGPFIREELRPDLGDAALALEPDLVRLRDELERRAQGLGG